LEYCPLVGNFFPWCKLWG